MKRYSIAACLLICCATGLSLAVTKPKTFISKEGHFSVQLPSRPTASLPKPSKDGADAGTTDFSIDGADSAYYVSFASAPPVGGPGHDPEAVLNAVRDDITEHGKRKLLSEKRIFVSNYPAREIAVARDATRSMRARLVIVHDLVYVVFYGGPNGKVNSPVTDSYLNSFTLFKPKLLPDTWKTFDTGDGKFTIQMPATPTPRSTKTSTDGEVNVWLLPDAATRVTYLAGYSVLASKPTKPEEIDKVLDNSREGTLAGMGAKLVEERWLSIDGYRGREWSLKVMQGDVVIGTALVRNVIVGNRLIQMGALGPTGALDKGRVSDYMDSFKLLPAVAEAK